MTFTKNPQAAANGTGDKGEKTKSAPYFNSPNRGGAGHSSLIATNRQNPCPICGRVKDGDCRIRPDGSLVLCHDGQRHTPARGRNPGNTFTGDNGATWAFVGRTKDDRAFECVPDKPRPGRNGNGNCIQNATFEPLAAVLPTPQGRPIRLAMRLDGPVDPGEDPTPTIYRYSPDLRVERVTKPGGKKAFYPSHLVDGAWERGAGPGQWPVFGQDDALAAAAADPGAYLLETEGEKCAVIARQGGAAAISMPGHARSLQQRQATYEALRSADVAGLVYLVDNDEAGCKYALEAAQAASVVGLPLMVLDAEKVWPGLPEKGSIDDATGDPSERVLAIAQAIAAGKGVEATVEGHEAEPATPKAAASLDIRSVREEAARIHNDPTIKSEDRLLELRAFATNLTTPFGSEDLKRYLMEARRSRSGMPDAVRTGDCLNLEAVPWLVEGLLLRSATNLIVAREKVGKTSLLTALVADWHYGCETFLGRRIHGPCPPVIILGTDMPSSDWARMLHRYHLADEKGRVLEPIKYLFHSGAPIYLDGQGLDRIAQIAEEYPGALFICDSYARLTAPLGLQEASADFAVPLMDLQEAIDPHGCTAWVIHHSGKGGITGRVDSRGTTALPATASQIVYLQPMTENEGDRRITLKTNGRGGPQEQLLIEQDEASGAWISHGDGRAILRLQALEKAEQELNARQSDVLELVRQRWTDDRLETTFRDVQATTGQIRQHALRSLSQLQIRGLLTSRKLVAAGELTMFRPAGEGGEAFEPPPAGFLPCTDSGGSNGSIDSKDKGSCQPEMAKTQGETGLNHLIRLTHPNQCMGKTTGRVIQSPGHPHPVSSPADPGRKGNLSAPTTAHARTSSASFQTDPLWLALARQLRERTPPMQYRAIQDELATAGFGDVKAMAIRNLLPPPEETLERLG